MKLYTETGVRLLRYLNLTLNNNTFEYVFLTYKPKKDYNDDYSKITIFC